MTQNLFTTELIPTYSVDNNPYDTIYVDVSHKCNMACHFCYNPVRNLPNMELEYFEEVCKRLPNRVIFRLLGGEPTLHPQLPEFIETAYKHRHVVTVVTNGLKFARDINYCRTIKSLKIPLAISISLDGGRNHDDWYEAIVNKRCATEKMAAIDNLAVTGFKRIGIGAIIVRDFNEAVIPDLLDIANQYKGFVRYVHYRSAAALGRWVDTIPYTAFEIKALLAQYIGDASINQPYKMLRDGINPNKPGVICRQCCYEFWKDPHLQISLIEFASENAARCYHRGQLLDNFEIQAFYANMIKRSEEILLGYQKF